MSLEVGAVINEQYTVIEHIGRGGMADVWSARDLKLNRMVAVKTIAHGLSQEVDSVGLFQQEAQTIAQMEHPHILPIHDFGDHEGKLYIVMRYITGGSLEDKLHSGPVDAETTLRIAEAVAMALDYAHDNSVIHLDLKPPNILLDSVGSPYLADFGLATVLDPEGRLGVGERQKLSRRGQVLQLRGRGLQEVATGRHVVEQIADRNRGALGSRARAVLRNLSALHAHQGSRVVLHTLGLERHLRYGRDGRQRLAPEAERANALVACRSKHRAASPRLMPHPSSITCTSVLPASLRITSREDAPASSAFSRSSFATEAGRWTTSPAAI